MKVTLFMVQTINGIIARNNYKEDFLSDLNWKTFLDLVQETNCFIIGRRTYQKVKKWKDYNYDNIKAAKIVVSRNPNLKLNKGYTLTSSPKDSIKKASKLGFKNILVTGGSKLNSAFMKEKLIDEIIINIEPYILGEGITIFDKEIFENKLKLFRIRRLNHGIVQLHYKVQK